MMFLRRPRAHLISILAVAAIAAGLLSSGQALLAPSTVSARPAGCDHRQKIAFIALPGVDGLEAMQAPLRKLSNIWPVRKLAFRYMTSPQDFEGAALDTIVNELESRVNNLESQGFKRIGLPSRSVLLEPFIYGTAGSLGGVDLQTRHPNTTFVTMNPGTKAVDDVDAAGNVFRFLDVRSLNASTGLAIDNLVGPSGEMLIIYQNGDEVSEGTRDLYLQFASNLGITAQQRTVGYNGSDFDALDMEQAAQAIDSLPAGSLVVHIVNGVSEIQDDYVAAALADGHIFVGDSSNGAIKHFGGNFFPSTAVPVVVELGYTTFDRPSWQSTRAGFSNRTTEWNDDTRQKLYMDAFGFLARCGKFNGILDGFLRFDEGGTRINKQLERIYLPADSLAVAYGANIDNERWYQAKYPWNWDEVFGE